MSEPTSSEAPAAPVAPAPELATPPASRRASASDVVHFALLRIVGTECRLHEVAASKYTQTAMLWPTLDRHVLRALTDEHRGVVADYVDGVEGDAKTRYDRVDSKLRTLLGVNGLAFSLITGFSLGGKPLFLLASGPFIVSAILALRALGVHTFQVPSLTAQEVGAELTALHAIRLQGRLSAANENACVVDFIVDCFRAAHRYFVVALIMLPLLYLGGRWLDREVAKPIAVSIAGLDPSAAGVLRGPPGAQGVPGPRGPEGQPGPKGQNGPVGSVAQPSAAPAPLTSGVPAPSAAPGP